MSGGGRKGAYRSEAGVRVTGRRERERQGD